MEDLKKKRRFVGGVQRRQDGEICKKCGKEIKIQGSFGSCDNGELPYRTVNEVLEYGGVHGVCTTCHKEILMFPNGDQYYYWSGWHKNG